MASFGAVPFTGVDMPLGQPIPNPITNANKPKISPDIAAVLIGSALGGVGQYFSNKNASSINDQNLAQNQQQFEISTLMDLLRQQKGDQLSRDSLGLQATQMDPLAHQKSRQQNAISQALLAGGPPKLTGFSNDSYRMGQFSAPDLSGALPFFTDEARANAEGDFFNSRAQANPDIPTPDLGAVGYGKAGADLMPGLEKNRLAVGEDRENANNNQIQAIQAALQAQVSNATGQQVPEGYEFDKKTGQLKKKGGGFMGFLKKALPLAAFAIPGLQGLGALGAMSASTAGAIGAGAGLAGAAINKDPYSGAGHGINFASLLRGR